MRSGRLAAIAGATCLAAACGAPAGVAGVSTLPPSPPVGGAPAAAEPSPTGAAGLPQAGDPVRIPPPKLSAYTYTFPVKGCKVSYSRKLLVLPKTTIWAGKGCAFVSPVDGVVREVNLSNQWKPSTDHGKDREGRFVTVKGEDGVLYLGGHLDSVEPGLRPGVRVKAGQRLGRVGNSGNARDTASNLYFAVSWPAPPAYWWVRRGMVPPWTYLDAWDDGNRTLSPRKETLALRKKVGTLPQCSQLCASKPNEPQPKETKPPKKADPDDTRVVVPLNVTPA
ncbi:M23 family metallopeptidase [Microbispora sp. NPDC049125]|uniref:M23 family metallopeptidase n=1 Tax=Microbispora sp. NPDC049125 TaxID=3154929 RepID=UPI003466EC94